VSRRLLIALALVLAAAVPAAAAQSTQTATLVEDINTLDGPENPGSSFPVQLTPLGDKVVFVAGEAGTGREPWVSDGTSAGTELLADSLPGPDWRPIQFYGPVRNLLFWTFQADLGQVLWRTDGTRQGTFELLPGTTGMRLLVVDSGLSGGSAAFGGRFYFVACPLLSAADCALWRSDGTPAGTQAVPGVPGFPPMPGLVSLYPVGNRLLVLRGLDLSVLGAGGLQPLTTLADRLRWSLTVGNRLFLAVRIGGVMRLTVTDGTAEGTRTFATFRGAVPQGGLPRAALGSGIEYLAPAGPGRYNLWKSDGTVAGTRLLAPLPANPFAGGAQDAFALSSSAGRPVFLSPDANGQERIWTVAGGRAVALTPTLVKSSLGLSTVGGRLFFVSGDTEAPWVTDGTAQGTRPLRPLNTPCSGGCGAPVQTIVPRGNELFFSDGQDLWRTDGTAAGTVQISTPPFHLQFYFEQFEAVRAGDDLFLSSTTPYGHELWVHDAAGENHVVADIARDAPSAAPRDLVALGDRLFFSACSGSEREVWMSPATGSGATRVAPMRIDCRNLSEPQLFAGVDAVFFLRRDGDGLDQLWRTDGSSILQLTDLPNGLNVTGFDTLAVALFRGKLVFTTQVATETRIVREFWESDGTVAGTLRASYLPTDLFSVSALTTLGDQLWFVGVDDQGTGIWRSDGTAAGTRKVAGALSFGSRSPRFTRLGGTVFFTAADDASGFEVWRSDGTAAGTSLLVDSDPGPGGSVDEMVTAQGRVFFFAERPLAARDTLWRSDSSTPAGTAALHHFPWGNNFNLQHFPTAALGHLFFAAGDAEHGAELWKTDGTVEGTVLIKDIAPGPRSSTPRGLVAAGGLLYFTADDGVHGAELWQSDGTAAGTRQVQDIAPEGLSSTPDRFTAVGSHLFFTADDGERGRELWSLPLSGPAGCQPSERRLCLGGRYQVEATWRDFEGHNGRGTAVALTADTGYFWFFDPANIETIVKVLDGRGVNGHVWVFYGALSNVEYTLTVTDTQTGLTRRYFNPSGQFASVGDTHGFGPLGAYSASPPPTVATPSLLPLVAARTDRAAAVPCQPTSERLCLGGSRFAVEVSWKDFQGRTGKGKTVPLFDGTGAFWFFDAANIELVVKVLDGRPLNDHFWLFYGALSNVEYTLTVTDTQTGAVKTYRNPSGRFASVGDTQAF
jgi:ELWxxDGT repeat protein